MKDDSPILNVRTRAHGYTLIETLIALAFLAVAAGLVVKMHHARMDFERDAMNHLTDRLDMENIAERLSLIEYADLPEASERLAEEFKMVVEIDSFESEIGNGRHVRIRTDSREGSIPFHLWKWEPKS